MPQIGDKAPEFKAPTSTGEISFPAWGGPQWVVFFSYPADFTPVCTSEIVEFARREKDFAQRGAKLLSISLDSADSHKKWGAELKASHGVDVNFPIVGDADGAIAGKYALVHSAASPKMIRAVYLVDPKQVIRAILYYPTKIGRNVDEILRLLDALRVADEKGAACPVNWKPGNDVIQPKK